jgi:hypothetical protein
VFLAKPEPAKGRRDAIYSMITGYQQWRTAIVIDYFKWWGFTTI